jgi:hypothetical protein
MATAAAATTDAGNDAADRATEGTDEPIEAEAPEPIDDAANDAAAAAAAAAESGDDGSESDADAEGDEKPDGKKPPEVEKALKDLTVDELTTKLTEDQLRKVAQKYSNKTMAAARKAERATGEVRQQNQQLTAQIGTYQGFVDQLQSNPMAALRRVPGWQALTFKELAQKVVDAGNAAPAEPPKVDPVVAALEKRLDDKEAAEKARDAEQSAAESQARVFTALEKDERFDLVLTDLGRPQLWDAITAYYGKHGRCPDDKVFEMADLLEQRLEASVTKSKKFARPAQKGTTPAGKPVHAVNKGKTITNRSTSAAPVTRTNRAETEEELDRRINAEMRAEGLI